MDKMITPRFRYLPLILAAALLCLTACESRLLSRLGVNDPSSLFDDASGADAAAAQEKMIVNQVEFAPDYKTFSVWTGVLQDLGPYPLTDTTVVKIEVESYVDDVKRSRRETPRLVKAWNTENDQVKRMGVKVLVLVDLSLPQEQIDAEQEAVQEMLTVFDQDDLFLAFMSGDGVTPTYTLSGYILQGYFNRTDEKKLLYRAMLDKIQEMEEGEGKWSDAKQLKLIVFSDGQVYDTEDLPYDPDHFKTENDLIHSLSQAGPDPLSVYYVNFGKNREEDPESESQNILASLCETSGGAFFPSFNWTLLETSMLGPDIRNTRSNRFDFENPDGKVYHGDDQKLRLSFYTVKDHKLIASVTAHIREGSFFKPIVVGGASFGEILMIGFSVGLLILLVIYVLGQFLLPLIRYRRFKRKYVIRHTGRAMAIGDVAVAERCYLCKAPFEEGDEVVVKCEHTMHKHCWDENEYHCPEYGRHCKNGSHFYDREHLLDKRNASFYLNWLLMAVMVGTAAWMVFMLVAHIPHKHLLELILPTGRVSQDVLNAHLTRLPSYGFILSFFLTVGVAFLAISRRRWVAYAGILLRGLVAGLCSMLLYLLMSLASIAMGLESASFLLTLIPWTLSSYLSVVLATRGTRIRLKKPMVLIAVGVSLISLFLWSLLYIQIGVDYRILMLYSTLIYMVGMALAIASAAPRSEHYFLHIEGPVKTMDVALYKWFRANPNAVVTLGKSVDCSLQLSWDLRGKVAPVHAEISMYKGVPRLKALEEGVYLSGKPLKVDRYVNLHYGLRFQIGQTRFDYQERDI